MKVTIRTDLTQVEIYERGYNPDVLLDMIHRGVEATVQLFKDLPIEERSDDY